MSASQGAQVTLSDFVEICTKAGEASGGVSTSMLSDLQTCSVTVTQTYGFDYRDTYEDYYRKGKCPIVSVKKGSAPDIPCISLSAKEHAILLRNIGGQPGGTGVQSCALLDLTYSTGNVFETSSITNMCSCKLIVPEDGKELRPNHLFDIDVVRAPFYKNINWGKTPDETGITSKTTADVRIRRNDGSYTTVTNAVTSITVTLDGVVYPKILAQRYKDIVYGISENLKTKLASKLALVEQPWFDGTGENGEFLHRCANNYSTSGFNGDVNFETFMCIMGGGMKGTAINCTGLGDGTAAQFTTNFADVKGGTCVVSPSSTPGACADGCPTTNGIKIGCLGDLGNESSNCDAGKYKVHAAWYNQMDAILDALDQYKYLEECPEKQILSSGGIGDRWNGYKKDVLWYTGDPPIPYPILGEFEKKEREGEGIPDKAYLGGCQAKTAVSGATKESNNAWGVGKGSYDMLIGGDGKQTGFFYLDFGYKPATTYSGAIDCCTPGVFGYLGRATIWLHVTGCSPSIKISLTPIGSFTASKIPSGTISVTGKAFPSGTSASGTAISLSGGSSTLSFASVKCRSYILIYLDTTIPASPSWNQSNQKEAPPSKYQITVEVS